MTLLLVRRKLLYVASLLIALVAIQRGTDAWVLSAVQRHEPSIRIFRSLLEIVLLLLCTAASLVVWKRFIPNSVTARLLFDGNDDKQMEDDDTDIPVTWNANDVNEDEQYDDSGDSDERAFLSTKDQPVNDRRDTLHRQSAATTESFQEQPQPQPQPPHHSDCDDDCNGNNDNNDVDINALNNPSPISVTSAALDLLIWILIALVFYSVAAAETIPLFLASTNYDGNNVDATTITTRLDSTATDNNITPRSSSSNNNHPQYYQGFWEALAGVAAPTFPLLLFAGATTKALYPWTRRRKQFYAVLSYTLSAPVYEVSFRDGMIVRMFGSELAREYVAFHETNCTTTLTFSCLMCVVLPCCRFYRGMF